MLRPARSTRISVHCLRVVVLTIAVAVAVGVLRFPCQVLRAMIWLRN